MENLNYLEWAATVTPNDAEADEIVSSLIIERDEDSDFFDLL